ncbi:MAG: methyltransferase domain-containing protein [Rhodothermales bacterium]
MSTSSNEIRERVSASYARAIELAEGSKTQDETSSCCGSDCCEPGVATVAEPEVIREDVPSFGCGDPLLFSEVREGDVVLDLGSGAGYDLLAAAAKVGEHGYVIGVDMTDAMIEAARRNAAAAGFKNIEVRKGIIENLPVATGTVDWVISNCVVNLSPEKDRVFAEIARVLKPGGRFSISDITADDLPEEVLQNASAYDGCISGAISEVEYLAGLEGAGLESVRTENRLPAHEIAADCGCETCDGPLDPAGLEGKVWSVRVTGRKPLETLNAEC